MKTVAVVGYHFDGLPGHVTANGRGTGSNLRVAICNAVREMLSHQRLKHKHIGEFKMSVVVIRDKGDNDEHGK